MTQDKPLYQQIRALLLKRIHKGEWEPGEMIPNEFEIAAEYDVSQGTARKAIGDLAAEGILTRQQGRGTYVTEHSSDPDRFPGFVDGRGERVELGSLPCSSRKGTASADECAALKLSRGAPVIRLNRVRTLKGAPVATESITLPGRFFRTFDPREATDNLYDLYQRSYGVHVVRTQDRLSAIPAEEKQARELSVAAGTPLLRIERTAIALDGQRVELRVNLLRPSDLQYLSGEA